MFKAVLAAVASAMLAASALAQPAQPALRIAVHNNSLMNVTTDPAGVVRITYNAPRPAMASIGVTPGMQLIEGRWIAPNQFAGTAVVFAPWCGTVFPYQVTGGMGPDNALHLFGPAPEISPWCTVAAYVINGNSDLVFWPYQ